MNVWTCGVVVQNGRTTVVPLVRSLVEDHPALGRIVASVDADTVTEYEYIIVAREAWLKLRGYL